VVGHLRAASIIMQQRTDGFYIEPPGSKTPTPCLLLVRSLSGHLLLPSSLADGVHLSLAHSRFNEIDIPVSLSWKEAQ